MERHVSDLGRDWEYYFDENKASLAIGFIRLLRHTKGALAKQPFQLQPFQEFFLAVLFGWQRKDGKGRRFRKAYLEIARKNGKTELAAAIACYCFLMDGEFGADIYTAATTRDQARIAFEAAKVMLRQLKEESKDINSLVGIYKFNIHIESTNSKFESVSSDASTLDGLNPHVGIIDEYHSHKTSEVLEVIETGMGSRPQPLLLVTTTAGFNRNSPCYHLRKVAADVLRGIKQDEAFFPLIFSLDEEDDWQDKTVWGKANPNLGQTPYWSYMEDQYNKAINEGATKQVQFQTKNLNVWTNSYSTWIRDDIWMQCKADYSEKDLAGLKCYGGLDLASTRDLTAFVLFLPPQDKLVRGRFLFYFFCPEDNIRERSIRDGVPYLQWFQDGYIIPTSGDVFDRDYVLEKVNLIAQKFALQTVAYDRWGAADTVVKLQEDGMKVSRFGQGWQSMTGPISEFERLVSRREIQHDGNPVARWMLSNVAIKFAANNTGMAIAKDKATEKVDGIVAAMMALGEWMTAEKPIDITKVVG